ncbi:MAG TPA: SUMF1/EgtB/PvdO family nonheme iron enzyme, partial [Planctomycetota bacterium]|nr:SUMF1/EgtB/PvdO family nonheme iron enzyme [Planctomycetota bacterium]
RLVPGGERRLVPQPIGETKAPVVPGVFSLRVQRDHGELRAADEIVELAGFPLRDLLLVADEGVRLVSVDGRATTELYDLDRVRDDRAGRPTESTGRKDPRAPASRPSGPARCEIERPGGAREIREVADLEGLLERTLHPAAAAARGGIRGVVARDGELVPVEIAAGTESRLTAAPLLATSGSRVEPGERALPAGSYLLLARARGFEPLRAVTALLAKERRVLRVRLEPAGTSPPGFVRVAGDARRGSPLRGVDVDLDPFWIHERETTCAEWAEFLDDPETRAADAAAEGRLVPRAAGLSGHDLWWRPDASGRYRWPEDWKPEWPVIGISLEDARAFASWRTRRAEARGEPWRYVVPTFPEWVEAAGSATLRALVYGDRFRPKWSNSCFSRPLTNPAVSFRFPIDESVYGAFDMNGNAFEWCDSPYDDTRRLYRAMGGGWGRPTRDLFQLWGGLGLEPERSTGETGLRLVAKMRG